MTTFIRLPLILNDRNIRTAKRRLDQIIDAKDGSVEAAERTALSDLIQAFEARAYALPMRDAISLLKN